MPRNLAIYEVEGTTGVSRRVRFRGATDLTGYTATVKLKRKDCTLDLLSAFTPVDSCGAYIDVTYSDGDLIAGCHEMEIWLAKGSELKKYPRKHSLKVFVRKDAV